MRPISVASRPSSLSCRILMTLLAFSPSSFYLSTCSPTVDMVSHELRNPLSAVWQNSQRTSPPNLPCRDLHSSPFSSVLSESLERIGEVLDDWDPANPDLDALRDIRREVQEDSEAVDSIILASSHQGKIADDILNVSKLSMNMLNIERVPFQLSSKIGEVLRMYEV